ncbi:putative zinc-binding protein [Polaromonas glacialis]|uniref:putative zinc-binding protein n=1 Tax=Polaromonas glacialis TaxID=866564 RepID=UPI000A070E9F|nr:putative zinc-binding protein [Polaromonas glacialis]
MNAAVKKPLVYSCSGCSSAAQMANHVAVRLDRSAVAEMSCIAGIGGDVPSLLKTARSGRPIVALDGCALVCVKSSLARHGITPQRHYQLQEYGVKKRQHEDFDPQQAALVLERVSADLLAQPFGPPACLDTPAGASSIDLQPDRHAPNVAAA